MALIPGKYKLENNENFVAFLTSLGVPADNAQYADKLRPHLTVNVSGDKIELVSDSGVKNTTTTFIIGQECDDPLPTEHIAKSTATLNGNTIDVKTSCAEVGLDGSRTYDFTSDGLTITYKGSVVAKRIYKRV
ncbi:fatty acid binding protein 1-A, liver-like [Onthophagus taurus]|uniref:fatty acid binding protein 1-A, liver-like n=1 Tax=Onthophagus taurus TaxID=166361 RepID=UPI000C2040EB|nr:fatty acid binding protein 1-A, liver-like [Onthophagus taurus]